MLKEDLELDDAIGDLIREPELSADALATFLNQWVAHPDYYTDLTGRVISNLSGLNIKFLNTLCSSKRFSLVKALCITVRLSFSMRDWEHMLGREDGAWFWEGHGLFFSSLHALIHPLNELQSHIAAIGTGFTGRIICLEGQSERVFLEWLHLGTRLISFDNQYFTYGGKGAHQNLVLYIRDKNRHGVRVDLAYDGDSNLQTVIPKLQRKVTIGSVFRFDRDFEAAFPSSVLAPAISAYLTKFSAHPTECSSQQVTEMLLDTRPLIKVIETHFSVNINKVIFGELLALEFLKLYERDHRVLHGAGLLTGTELSRFIRWICKMPQDVSPLENEELDISFEVDASGKVLGTLPPRG